MTFPTPSQPNNAASGTTGLSLPTDLASAYLILVNSVQSAAGLVRLSSTLTLNAAELAAMELIRLDATYIGTAYAKLLNEKIAPAAALTLTSAWSLVHTNIDTFGT